MLMSYAFWIYSILRKALMLSAKLELQIIVNFSSVDQVFPIRILVNFLEIRCCFLGM